MNNPMEKRKSDRFDSVQLISYKSTDQDQFHISQGMGKTINVSETGALIEVHTPIEKNHEVDIFFIVGKRQLTFRGKVMYRFRNKKSRRSSYCGINFKDADHESFHIFKKYLSILNQNQLRSQPGEVLLKRSTNRVKKPLPDVTYVTGPSPDYVYIVEEEAYKAGTQVISKGNYGSWVYVILEGTAEVIRNTKMGPTAIQRLGPGSIIGGLESALIRNYERSTTIMATTPLYLGILDNHRLFNEYRNMSYPLQKTILSLCNRLQRVKRSAEELISRKKKIHIMENKPFDFKNLSDLNALYQIREGSVVVARKGERGFIPISNLFPGDVYGSLPLFNPEISAEVAYVSQSDNIKQNILDIEMIKREYEGLSTTYQNIMSNYNMRISTLNNLIVDIYSKIY